MTYVKLHHGITFSFICKAIEDFRAGSDISFKNWVTSMFKYLDFGEIIWSFWDKDLICSYTGHALLFDSYIFISRSSFVAYQFVFAFRWNWKKNTNSEIIVNLIKCSINLVITVRNCNWWLSFIVQGDP